MSRKLTSYCCKNQHAVATVERYMENVLGRNAVEETNMPLPTVRNKSIKRPTFGPK